MGNALKIKLIIIVNNKQSIPIMAQKCSNVKKIHRFSPFLEQKLLKTP